MPTTALMAVLPPSGWRFAIDWGDEIATQRGGQVRVKQLRPDLWSARYETGGIRPDLMREIKGQIADLGGSRQTFYAWDPGAQAPKGDPRGAGLLAATVRINSLNGDSQRLSLKGLPAGYMLARGDLLAFDYGAGPARALHVVRTATVTASAGGITPEFFVAPNVRPGASVDAIVRLVKPAAEMMIVPGSLDLSEGPRVRSVAFDAIQVI